MDFILELDQSLFIFLNSLGSDNFDKIWLTISNKETWYILYLIIMLFYLPGRVNNSLLGFLSFYQFKPKNRNRIFFILIATILIIFTDQSSNFFKDYFERLRPCHNPDISSLIRIVKEGCGGLYGFFSAHSANTFAFAMFIYLNTKIIIADDKKLIGLKLKLTIFFFLELSPYVLIVSFIDSKDNFLT